MHPPDHDPHTGAVWKKLLFVCSRNRIRSLTAEKIFEGAPGIHVRSVGTQPEARIRVSEGHLGWADLVVCMEKSHAERLRQRFPEALRGRKIVTLHIRDEYEFMQPELVDCLRRKLAPHLPIPPAPSDPAADGPADTAD